MHLKGKEAGIRMTYKKGQFQFFSYKKEPLAYFISLNSENFDTIADKPPILTFLDELALLELCLNGEEIKLGILQKVTSLDPNVLSTIPTLFIDVYTAAWSPSVVITDKFVFRKNDDRLSKLEKMNHEFKDSQVSASVKISKFLYPIKEFCNNLVEDIS